MHLIDAGLIGDDGGDAPVVAGEHDDRDGAERP
jgi:hypothetical protein